MPFGKKSGGIRADMGQTRGAQSGEADRHAIWLTANNMEPRLSPFDPFAILDEIQRLVPGYDKLLRLQLLSGNAQHIEPAAIWSSSSPTARTLSCPPATRCSPPARSATTAPCSSTSRKTSPASTIHTLQIAAD